MVHKTLCNLCNSALEAHGQAGSRIQEDLPACAAWPATEAATRPFWDESEIPLTSLTTAMLYCRRSTSSEAALALGGPSPPPPSLQSRRDPLLETRHHRMATLCLMNT